MEEVTPELSGNNKGADRRKALRFLLPQYELRALLFHHQTLAVTISSST